LSSIHYPAYLGYIVVSGLISTLFLAPPRPLSLIKEKRNVIEVLNKSECFFFQKLVNSEAFEKKYSGEKQNGKKSRKNRFKVTKR